MSARIRMASLLAVIAILSTACTRTPEVVRTPSPTATPVPSTSVTPTPRAVFDAARAMAHDRSLSVTIGSREAGSPAYERAARYVRGVFDAAGFDVRDQRVPIPAGRSQGVPVPSGDTVNVIATAPGFDTRKPHLVVGAHLDTVTPSPGANDNGSGVAVMLELARLASIRAPAMPVVWIAFGGEERRRPGATGALYGSRYYLAHLSQAEKKAIRGMIALDMVGAGSTAFVCHESLTGDDIVDAMLASARRLKLPASKRIVLGVFSDHATFEHAGYVVGWLWSGEHATLHTPRDRFSIVQRSSVDRIGRIAWDTLTRLRL